MPPATDRRYLSLDLDTQSPGQPIHEPSGCEGEYDDKWKRRDDVAGESHTVIRAILAAESQNADGNRQARAIKDGHQRPEC